MKTARVLLCCVGFALMSCAACNQTKPTVDLTAAPTLLCRIMILDFSWLVARVLPIATPTPTYIVSTKAPEPTGSMISGENYFPAYWMTPLVYIRCTYLMDGNEVGAPGQATGAWLGDIPGTVGPVAPSPLMLELYPHANQLFHTPSWAVRTYLVEDGRYCTDNRSATA